MTTFNHNTNNIAEAAFHRIKDRILKRRKCTSPIQLAEFMTTVLSDHFIGSVLDLFMNTKNFKPAQKGSRNAWKLSKEIPDEWS